MLPNALETRAACVVMRSSRTTLCPILRIDIFIIIMHLPHQRSSFILSPLEKKRNGIKSFKRSMSKPVAV